MVKKSNFSKNIGISLGVTGFILMVAAAPLVQQTAVGPAITESSPFNWKIFLVGLVLLGIGIFLGKKKK